MVQLKRDADRINVGDRVEDPDGVARIVTDIRQGDLILRPEYGGYKEMPVSPDKVRRLPNRSPLPIGERH